MPPPQIFASNQAMKRIRTRNNHFKLRIWFEWNALSTNCNHTHNKMFKFSAFSSHRVFCRLTFTNMIPITASLHVWNLIHRHGKKYRKTLAAKSQIPISNIFYISFTRRNGSQPRKIHSLFVCSIHFIRFCFVLFCLLQLIQNAENFISVAYRQ